MLNRQRLHFFSLWTRDEEQGYSEAMYCRKRASSRGPRAGCRLLGILQYSETFCWMWRRQVLQPMLVLSRVPRLPQTSHSARELPEVAGVTGVEGTCGGGEASCAGAR